MTSEVTIINATTSSAQPAAVIEKKGNLEGRKVVNIRDPKSLDADITHYRSAASKANRMRNVCRAIGCIALIAITVPCLVLRIVLRQPLFVIGFPVAWGAFALSYVIHDKYKRKADEATDKAYELSRCRFDINQKEFQKFTEELPHTMNMDDLLDLDLVYRDFQKNVYYAMAREPAKDALFARIKAKASNI